MFSTRPTAGLVSGCLVMAALLTALVATGCASGRNGIDVFGSPFQSSSGTTSTGTTGPGSTGIGIGAGTANTGSRADVDPCTETEERKYIRISMRNDIPVDNVHYFLTFIAYINDPNGVDGYTDGAVCPADEALYRSNGYSIKVNAGEQRVFGNYCIDGPALIWYYQSGRFRSTGVGSTDFASAIGQARGTVPTYDAFFSSAGARIPVPNIIMFHNPGTGEGAALIVDEPSANPCDPAAVDRTSNCARDAFYYVDDSDLMSGTPTLGPGSGRRVPNEIQDTLCVTEGDLTRGYHTLAPSGVTPATALDHEFLRGGKIEYVFIRADQDPPIPQLLWKVTDERGALVHDFDSRSGTN